MFKTIDSDSVISPLPRVRYEICEHLFYNTIIIILKNEIRGDVKFRFGGHAQTTSMMSLESHLILTLDNLN